MGPGMTDDRTKEFSLTTEKRPDGSAVYTALAAGRPIGYVAVDSTMAGRSCGGLRMMPDVAAEEVSGLARAMTLKYGFLGVPQGGAKAGVIGDPESPLAERFALLTDFGRAIRPLLAAKAYVPGTDMGTDGPAIRHMLESVGLPAGPRDLRGNSSGYYTALSVMAAVTASARHAGRELAGSTAVVEGFGHVGSALAGLLAAAGVRVVGVSTLRGALYDPAGLDVARLASLAGEVGGRVVDVYGRPKTDRRTLVLAQADIVCPCARHASITSDNASHVQASIVCPGANNPISPEAESILSSRGVVWLPDFLCNCGGVLGGTMEFAALGHAEIESTVRTFIESEAARILKLSADSGRSPRAISEEASRARFARVKEAVEHPTPSGRVMGLAIGLYHSGIMPSWLVRPAARRYFGRLLERK
jgi:glutamate dehydrogenase (NAD(P)+)